MASADISSVAQATSAMASAELMSPPALVGPVIARRDESPVRGGAESAARRLRVRQACRTVRGVRLLVGGALARAARPLEERPDARPGERHESEERDAREHAPDRRTAAGRACHRG